MGFIGKDLYGYNWSVDRSCEIIVSDKKNICYNDYNKEYVVNICGIDPGIVNTGVAILRYEIKK